MVNVLSWFKQKFFKDLIKNTFTILSGSFGGSLLGLISFSLTVKHLGAYSYGMFVILQTYIGIFDTLFNFQSWEAVIKFGSQSLIKENKEEIKRYIKLGTLFDVSSAVVGTLFAYIFAPTIGRLLGWEYTQIILVRIYSIAILLNLTGTARGVLRLLGKYNLIALHRVTGSAFKVVLVILAYFMKLDFFFFSLVLILSEIMDFVILLVFYSVVLKRNNLNKWILSPIGEVKSFFKFGVWTNLSSMISMPIIYFDKIFISKYLSYEAVSVYKLLNQFAFIIRKILISIYSSLYPELAKKIAENKNKESFNISIKLGIIILVVGLPVFLLFAVTVKLWIGPFFGAVFIPFSPLLVYYIGYKYFIAAFVSVDSLFLSLGYVRAKLIIISIAVAEYLILIQLLGPLWGLVGFVISEICQELTQISLKTVFIHIKHKHSLRS